MSKYEFQDLQLWLDNINTYSHLIKGIDLKKKIKAININFYYDDENHVEKNINEIIFTDSGRLVFHTYEEMKSYIRGMSNLIDVIKATKQ